MKFRISYAIGMASLSVGLVMGCGSGDTEPDTAEPAVSAIPARVDLATLTMPLDSSVYDFEEQRLLDRARAVLTTECLRRFGFPIAVPTLPDAHRKGHEELYGVDDPETAQRVGYHVDEVKMRQRPREPELSPAAYAVMHGEVASSAGQDVPKDGCLGEARSRLKSVDQDSVAPPNKLVGEAGTRARQDSRVVAAIERWSDCMGKRGYQYEDPWDANDDKRWQQTKIATPQEIQVAVADVACKEATKLVPIWATVEAAYQQELADKNAESLQALRQRMDTEMHNAAEILAGGYQK